MKKLLSIVLSVCMLLSITAGLNLTAYADESVYNNDIIESNMEKIKVYITENGELDEENNLTVKYTKAMTSVVDGEEVSKDFDTFISILNDDSLLFRMKAFESDVVLYSEMNVPTNEPDAYRLYVKLGMLIEDDEFYLWGAYTDINRDYESSSFSANYTIDLDVYGLSYGNEEANVYGEGGLLMWNITLDDLLGLNLGAVGFHTFCTEHNNQKEVEKPSTCTEEGIEKCTCQICGLVTEEAIGLSAVHKWDKGVVTKAPTCTAKGTRTYTCTDCGATKTEAISATGHKTKTVTTKATYAKAGKTETKCTVCGKVTSTKTIAKLTVPKITLSSVKSKKSKQITVTWKKNTKVTGYEVQYATNSGFTKNKKTVTVTKNSTTTKTISKLKSKTKYYVRVRGYVIENGKKYYSTWSSAKSVTTKK